MEDQVVLSLREEENDRATLTVSGDIEIVSDLMAMIVMMLALEAALVEQSEPGEELPENDPAAAA